MVIFHSYVKLPEGIDLFIWKRFATGVWNILMLTPAIANYGYHDQAAPADGTLEETGLHVEDLEHPFEPLSASSWTNIAMENHHF